MDKKIEERVKVVLSQQLGISVNKIANHHFFNKDLGADSLDSVSLLVALEEELGIEISDADALKILTVQDAIDYSKRVLEKEGVS